MLAKMNAQSMENTIEEVYVAPDDVEDKPMKSIPLLQKPDEEDPIVRAKKFTKKSFVDQSR